MDGTHGRYAPLRDEARRFNQLQRDIEGISQKMLGSSAQPQAKTK